ncbi:MAG: VWA domain-containing protein [Acidobacteriota bacterium]
MQLRLRHSRALRALATAAALALACPLAAAAQDLFLDTVDVRVINVEVMVTDKDGAPVTGLTRDDFEVLEDGEPVELTNFLAIEQRQARDREEAELLGGPTEPATRNLQLVVFVDENNLDPRNRNLLFDKLKELLDGSWGAEDQAMLVALGDTLRVSEPFTGDAERLRQAITELEQRVGGFSRTIADYRGLQREIQRAALEPPNSGGFSNPLFETAVLDAERLARRIRTVAEQRRGQTQHTVEHLGRFVRTLASLPGRKALLFLSDGLPTQPADALVEAWRGKFEDWLIQNGQNGALGELTCLGSGEFDTTRLIDDLVEEAAAQRVAFYPITPGSRLAGNGVSAEFAGSGTTDGRGAFSRTARTLEQMSLESSLLRLAEETGGVAFTRTSNLAGLMARIENDVTTFYSLGYSPSQQADEEYHEIEIRLRSPEAKGLVVRHLQGYREKNELEVLQDQTLSALHYGVTDNALDVRLEPGAAEATGKDRFEVPVMVKIPFEKLLLLPSGERHRGQVTLFVAVRDDQGRISPFQQIDLPIEIPNERLFEALTGAAAYPMRLAMRGGAQRIAVGARDRVARIDATVNLEIDVGAESEQGSR